MIVNLHYVMPGGLTIWIKPSGINAINVIGHSKPKNVLIGILQ